MALWRCQGDVGLSTDTRRIISGIKTKRMATYFSSDWHLGHANIIKYDGRPFKSVDEMDLAIINNVTGQLQDGDNLYYLGDFCMTRTKNDMEGHMKALA